MEKYRKVSIVIPIYNESDNLVLLNKQLIEVLNSLEIDYEIVYVDDGSCDGSGAVLKKIHKDSNQVKIVSLSRNFGQTQAISAGIDNSDGDVVIAMDADLQNDPADIPRLLEKLEEGYDVVSGWRKNRRDSFWSRKVPSYLANLICGLFVKIKLHDLGCTLKAYRRTVLEQIEFCGEIHRILPLYAMMQGAKITEIPVKHHPRQHGVSKYGMSRIFKVTLDILTMLFLWKFVTKPIYIFGGIGIVLLGCSSLTLLFIILRKILWAGVWVSPLLFLFVIFLIIGIQFILMGILAELIIRLYYGAKSQKRYKVREVLS
ncbi:MAG: glycosyltransferase [PVC group bacterium]|nr:glycosyltransferase [PVC group bacterium]